MSKDILVEAESGQTRVAVLEDGRLMELYIEREGQEKLVGNIYKGRVANVLPGMQAAFVDIGLDKNAFLYAGDIQVDRRDAEGLHKQLKETSIRQMVKPGQEVLVQVTKVAGGTKGPRITNHVTLPGRMAVLLPTVSYVGISRRIEEEQERARLRTLAEALTPEGMGVIVRTAAEGVSPEELKQDIDYLTRLWESIARRARVAMPPCLLHRDEGLIYRAVRDMLKDEVDSLWVDGAEPHRFIQDTAQMLSPALSGKVRRYEGETPLFDLHRVDDQAAKALSRRVWLKSGGYLVIDHAEALTVIDVNTGKFVGEKNLSETVFSINCEAVSEIARQLRLRDVGGIIVIDFIDMDQQNQREALVELLRQELKKDRSKTNLVGLTALGLVEMTRKKVQQPIRAVLKQTCPICQGEGAVYSGETIARGALHVLNGKLRRGESSAYLIHCAAAVAGELERLGVPAGSRIYVKEERCSVECYDIEPVAEHQLPAGAKKLPAQRG